MKTFILLSTLLFSSSSLIEDSKICISREEILNFKRQVELSGVKKGIIISWAFIRKSCAEKGEASIVLEIKGKTIKQRIICRPAKQI